MPSEVLFVINGAQYLNYGVDNTSCDVSTYTSNGISMGSLSFYATNNDTNTEGQDVTCTVGGVDANISVTCVHFQQNHMITWE